LTPGGTVIPGEPKPTSIRISGSTGVGSAKAEKLTTANKKRYFETELITM
jgi:hypothetical protein